MGECACATRGAGAAGSPPLLRKELNLDRRAPPPQRPAARPVPSFEELARKNQRPPPLPQRRAPTPRAPGEDSGSLAAAPEQPTLKVQMPVPQAARRTPIVIPGPTAGVGETVALPRTGELRAPEPDTLPPRNPTPPPAGATLPAHLPRDHGFAEALEGATLPPPKHSAAALAARSAQRDRSFSEALESKTDPPGESFAESLDVPTLPNAQAPGYADRPAAEPPRKARAQTPRAPAARRESSPASAVVEHRAEPAPLWRRLCAWSVDLLLLCLVVATYLLVGSLVVQHEASGSELGGIDAVMTWLHAVEPLLLPGVLLAVVVTLAYTAVFALVWGGCTPGRRLFGIRLVDQSGLSPTPSRALARAALAGVSAALFFSGFWVALFDPRGQTLHDKLTSTFVVLPS